MYKKGSLVVFLPRICQNVKYKLCYNCFHLDMLFSHMQSISQVIIIWSYAKSLILRSNDVHPTIIIMWFTICDSVTQHIPMSTLISNSKSFLQCVLQKLPDQVYEIKIVPKLRTHNRPWPNIISYERDQDTSACHISGHSSHVFSWECWETPNFTHFIKCFFDLTEWPWKLADYLESQTSRLISQGKGFHKITWTIEENSRKYCPKKCDGETDGLTDRHGVFIQLLAIAKNSVEICDSLNH